MATSNNDRISSAKLATFATKLWTRIKDTFAKKDDLADVATSGDYGDLANVPVESLFYVYYGTTTATEVQAAVSNKKIPVLVMSATDNTVKGYYCGSRNGNYYFESADNPPDPRDDQDIKEKAWFYVYGDTWDKKTVPLYAEKADGIVDNSDDERICKAQYWGSGCSISSLSPTGTNKQSGSKYVAGFYNDGNAGVLAPCDAANVTVGTSTVAESVVMGTRISLSSTVTHDTLYSKSAPGGSTEPAQVSAYRFNNGGSSPTSDGMVINIPWSSSYGRQLCLDDESGKMWTRYLNNGTWSSWSALSAPAGGPQHPVYVDGNGVINPCTISFSVNELSTTQNTISFV